MTAESPDGTEDWIVYHTKRFLEDGYETYRYTFVQRFGWHADDTPNFGTPVGWEETVVVKIRRQLDRCLEELTC